MEIQLHSNSVQEIISRPPKLLIRVGVYIAVCSFIIIIISSFFIPIPRVISEHIIISASLSEDKELIEDSVSFYGDVIVPSAEYGLIQVGQTVNIKLHAYPYIDFGTLLGKVSHVSNNPFEIGGSLAYDVSIILPSGLLTTNDITIPFAYKLEGIAEIQVEQKMLSDMILEPVKLLFSNSRSLL